VYEDYLKTEDGQAALALAEHERKRIDYLLSLPSWQRQMTPEQMAEYRLILIGERRVWTFLLTEPDRLKRELNQLEGKEEEADDNKIAMPSDKLADRSKELMDQFKVLDLGTDNVPPEIAALDDDPSEENQKKAGHAFKKARDFSRTAVGVIEEQQEEIKRLREEKPSPPQQPQAGQAMDPAHAGMLIEQQLQMAAMQRIGIADPEHPLVKREANALYIEQRQQAQEMASAPAAAASAFETVAAEFDQFADEDKASVQEALSSVPALEQTPDRIRKEFHAYRGANFEKFVTTPKPGGNGDKGKTTDAGATAAAISFAKKGVAPGEGSPQAGSDKTEVKPATPEERKEMASVSLDANVPANVALFRRSQKKKSKYEPR
jgi:hypothetical protein